MKYIYCFIFLILLNQSVKSQWTLQGLGYTVPNIPIRQIKSLDNNVVWTSTLQGYDSVYHFSRTCDGGTNWQPGIINGASSNGMYTINRICAVSFDTAWVLVPSDSGHHVYKTSDGGQSWIEQFPIFLIPPLNLGPLDIHFWNSNEGFSMGQRYSGYFHFVRTIDGGNNWTPLDSINIPPPLNNSETVASDFLVCGNRIYVITNSPYRRILRSIDRGIHWSVITSPPFTATSYGCYPVRLFFQNSSHGIATLSLGCSQFAETFDGGISWLPFTPVGINHFGQYCWVPGTSNTIIGTGIDNTGANGCSFSLDGGHTWTEFDTLTGQTIYQSGWADSTCGWVGSRTYGSNPAATGIWKFKNTIVDILRLDPRKGGFKLYPNPTNGPVNFITVGVEEKPIGIEVFSMSGKKVYEFHYLQDLSQLQKKINLSFLPAGTYFAYMTCGSRVFMEKIIIEK